MTSTVASSHCSDSEQIASVTSVHVVDVNSCFLGSSVVVHDEIDAKDDVTHHVDAADDVMMMMS